jgi:hypothetical protein
MTNYDEIRIKQAEEIVHKLEDFANSFITGKFEEHFADMITSCHRTIQQNIFRLFLPTIKKWARAYEENRYDLRNEDTVKTCKKMIDALGEEDLYLRFI